MRIIPEDRIEQLVHVATKIFIAQGYRRTQMADVAARLGVAKGTVYGYVEGKDALLSLCLLGASGQPLTSPPLELPVPTPAPGSLRAAVEAGISARPLARLSAAARRGKADDIGAELGGILEELYDAIEASCVAIKLIERVGDHPEVFEVWQAQGRRESRQLLRRYLEKRIRAGQLRPAANVKLAARFAIETITTWALHIKWDSTPEEYDPAEVRRYVVDQVAAGLMPPD